MNNFIKASLLVSAASFVATSAFAQSSDEPHFYGSISYERLSVDVGPKVNFNSVLLRGGYRFSRYFGAEAELGTGLKGDRVKINGTDVKFKSGVTAGIYGVGFVPLSDNFDLVGRVGYKRIGIKAESAVAGFKSNTTGVAWSAGAQYFWSDTSGIRLDYGQESGGDVKTITLGYQVRF